MLLCFPALNHTVIHGIVHVPYYFSLCRYTSFNGYPLPSECAIESKLALIAT